MRTDTAILHTFRRQQGKASPVVLVLLALALLAGLFALWQYSASSGASSVRQSSVSVGSQAATALSEKQQSPEPAVLSGQHNKTQVSPVQEVPVQDVNENRNAPAVNLLKLTPEQRAERRQVMIEKAQEYREKRQALLEKCRDYEILGMLEEKKLECLDYLAEKRADAESEERRLLRDKLKRKF